jgi:hypothetical protein
VLHLGCFPLTFAAGRIQIFLRLTKIHEAGEENAAADGKKGCFDRLMGRS